MDSSSKTHTGDRPNKRSGKGKKTARVTFSQLPSELIPEYCDPSPLTAVRTIARTSGNGDHSTVRPATPAELRCPLPLRDRSAEGDDEPLAGPSTSGAPIKNGGPDTGAAVATLEPRGSLTLGADGGDGNAVEDDAAEGDGEQLADPLPQEAPGGPDLVVDNIIVENETRVSHVPPGTVVTRLRNVPSLEILSGRFGGACVCPRQEWIKVPKHDCGKHS